LHQLEVGGSGFAHRSVVKQDLLVHGHGVFLVCERRLLTT
jgi:hypothetical protein